MEYTIENYLSESERTLSKNFFFDGEMVQSELHAAMGISTEAGELVEAVNMMRMDIVNVHEELGDINWYAAIFQRNRGWIYNYETHEHLGFKDIDQATQHIVVQSSKLLNLYKRAGFYNKQPTEYDVVKNVVSILDACNYIYKSIGVSPISSLRSNISKLKKRYPEKFDSDKAVNRDLEQETAALKL